MRNPHLGLKVPFLILWAVILSAFTAVLSGAPLKVLRTLVGPAAYWMVGFALAFTTWGLHLYPLAFIIVTQTILVGAYCEFDERDFSIRQSALLSLVLTALVISSTFYLWVAIRGKNWLGTLTDWMSQFLLKATALNIQILDGVKPEMLIAQIPSAILIFLILSLAFSLVFEKTISKWAGLPIKRREKLSDFSVFDAMIWLFIVSLLGTFAQTGVKSLEIVSLNVFNVCVAAYFFQGLAILAKYFEIFRVGPIWRALWVFLLVIQLPIVLSLVGVIDLWANFRKFFSRRAADLRKKRIQE